MGIGNSRSLLPFFFLTLSLFAVQAQKVQVKGTVSDTDNGPMPGVNIHVKNTATGTLTDLDGRYSLEVEKGNILVFSYIGMTTREKQVEGALDLNIILEPESTELSEIVVKSRKPVLQAEKGKLIFNVQSSALTGGVSALELLKKLPGISAGQNDEIIFKGTGGVNVMINGEMTYLSGNQLTNYLKGLSAEDIEKIELITTPMAEFDASGNAGIINIVPKKNREKGYALDLRTSLSKGKYWMTNENLSTSLVTEKINIYGSLDFNTPHRFSENRSGNTLYENGDALQLRRNNESSQKINYYTWRAGAHWQFSTKHTIGATYHGYFDDYKSSNSSLVEKTDRSGAVQGFIRSKNDIVEPYHFNSVGLHYRYDIDSLGKKFTSEAKYTSYRNYSDGLMVTENLGPEGNANGEDRLHSHQPGYVWIKSVKTDVDLPSEKVSVKAGLKFAEVENDNRYRFDTVQGDDLVEIESMGDHFRYKERITAAYLSASKNIGKTNIEAGLRMEHTDAKGHTVKGGTVNQWDYTNLFPSLSIEHLLNGDHKIGATFSRRINRPSYTDLNPVRWYTDRYFFFSGNPDLLPEINWIYDLTYSFRGKYVFAATYNQTTDYINRRLVVEEDGAIKSQSTNFGKRHRFDLTSSIPMRLFAFWDFRFFSDVSYTSYPISQLVGEKKLSQWAATLSLQQDISLPKDYVVNISANVYSSELRGIYRTHPTRYVDLGVKKSFLNDRLDVRLTIRDLLNTDRFKAFSQSDVTDYFYDEKPYSRIVGLLLVYHIGGKLARNEPEKTDEEKRL